MRVFSPEFSGLLRRVLRVVVPLGFLGVLVVVLSVVAVTIRYRSRERRGLLRARPKRYRIAPIP
jgi:hypothetical protein